MRSLLWRGVTQRVVLSDILYKLKGSLNSFVVRAGRALHVVVERYPVSWVGFGHPRVCNPNGCFMERLDLQIAVDM